MSHLFPCNRMPTHNRHLESHSFCGSGVCEQLAGSSLRLSKSPSKGLCWLMLKSHLGMDWKTNCLLLIKFAWAGVCPHLLTTTVSHTDIPHGSLLLAKIPAGLCTTLYDVIKYPIIMCPVVLSEASYRSWSSCRGRAWQGYGHQGDGAMGLPYCFLLWTIGCVDQIHMCRIWVQLIWLEGEVDFQAPLWLKEIHLWSDWYVVSLAI